MHTFPRAKYTRNAHLFNKKMKNKHKRENRFYLFLKIQIIDGTRNQKIFRDITASNNQQPASSNQHPASSISKDILKQGDKIKAKIDKNYLKLLLFNVFDQFGGEEEVMLCFCFLIRIILRTFSSTSLLLVIVCCV